MKQKIYTYTTAYLDETVLDKSVQDIKYISKKQFKKLTDDGLEYRIGGKTKLKEAEEKEEKENLLSCKETNFIVNKCRFTRVVGYIPVDDGVFLEYRKTILPFIILFFCLLIGLLLFVFTRKPSETTPVISPDFELTDDDKNQIQAEETEAGHTVYITLPDGEVSLEDKIYTFENESLKASKQDYKEEVYSGKLSLTAYMEKDEAEYLIFDDEVNIQEGTLDEVYLDFLLQKTELAVGVYDGRILLTYGEEEVVETDLKVVIRDMNGGTMEIGFNPDVEIALDSGTISMSYQADSVSSHDTILQLILDQDGEEYLLAESGVIKPGNGLNRMMLLDDAPSLSKGQYSGRLRLNFYNIKDESDTDLTTDINVKITVH